MWIGAIPEPGLYTDIIQASWNVKNLYNMKLSRSDYLVAACEYRQWKTDRVTWQVDWHLTKWNSRYGCYLCRYGHKLRSRLFIFVKSLTINLQDVVFDWNIGILTYIFIFCCGIWLGWCVKQVICVRIYQISYLG